MQSRESEVVNDLAETLVLGSLLDRLRQRWGGYKLLDHWQQGEFHHDLVLQLDNGSAFRGKVLVVATNCNGGVKEVLCMAAPPDRGGLWRSRCPTSAEFTGPEPAILSCARTAHWFDPCELLGADARSEYKEEW